MNKPLATFALALGASLLALVGNPSQAATQQGEGPPLPRCKKVQSNPCNSCAELGVLDLECKSGDEYKDCDDGTDHVCSNSAICNQAVGDGTCP